MATQNDTNQTPETEMAKPTNYAKYPCGTDLFLTKAEKAEQAFKARLIELGMTADDEAAMEAWENAFSVEVYKEYADDAERWEVALNTLNMLLDAV